MWKLGVGSRMSPKQSSNELITCFAEKNINEIMEKVPHHIIRKPGTPEKLRSKPMTLFYLSRAVIEASSACGDAAIHSLDQRWAFPNQPPFNYPLASSWSPFFHHPFSAFCRKHSRSTNKMPRSQSQSPLVLHRTCCRGQLAMKVPAAAAAAATAVVVPALSCQPVIAALALLPSDPHFSGRCRRRWR